VEFIRIILRREDQYTTRLGNSPMKKVDARCNANADLEQKLTLARDTGRDDRTDLTVGQAGFQQPAPLRRFFGQEPRDLRVIDIE